MITGSGLWQKKSNHREALKNALRDINIGCGLVTVGRKFVFHAEKCENERAFQNVDDGFTVADGNAAGKPIEDDTDAFLSSRFLPVEHDW